MCVLYEAKSRNLHNCKLIVKLWFTNLYFVGFYFVPNLIIIIFNLVYPIFIVGFDCKGCVLERESVKTQASEDRRLLASVSRLSWWRQLCLASISRVRPSRETPVRHSVLPVCTVWDTRETSCYPQMWRRASERKP